MDNISEIVVDRVNKFNSEDSIDSNCIVKVIKVLDHKSVLIEYNDIVFKEDSHIVKFKETDILFDYGFIVEIKVDEYIRVFMLNTSSVQAGDEVILETSSETQYGWIKIETEEDRNVPLKKSLDEQTEFMYDFKNTLKVIEEPFWVKFNKSSKRSRYGKRR